MYYIHIVTTREYFYNLLIPVLYARQVSFIYSMRCKIVDLFTLFPNFINTFTEDHRQTISELPKRIYLLILLPQQTEFHFKILSNL